MNFDSILKVIRGLVKLKGATSGTLIGNVSDALKVNVASFGAGATNDFFLEVARGNVLGMSAVNKFGFNGAVGPVALEDVWDGSSLYEFPTVAQTVNVKSTDSNDTLTGTGARTVYLSGLNSSFEEISETVELDGTTDVLSVNSYLRLHRMKAIGVGSTLHNLGDITAFNSTDTKLLAQMSEGMGQTLMSIYTVPAGKTAYLVNWHVTLDAEMSLIFFVRCEGEAFQAKRKVHIDTVDTQTWLPYLAIEEKCDIRVQAQSATGNNHVSSEFNMILVDN